MVLLQMSGQDPKWQKDAADQNFDYMFKLLIIGNSSVGKTSFLFRYADDSFTSAFVSTVGIDFKVKTVFRHDKRVKLQIWVSILLGSWTVMLFARQPNLACVIAFFAGTIHFNTHGFASAMNILPIISISPAHFVELEGSIKDFQI